MIAVAARLAGYRGVNAFAQFAALLSQEQLEAVGASLSGDGWRFQRLSVRFQSRLSGLSQMSFLGSARFIWVLPSS